MSVRYLAEISKRTDYDPTGALPYTYDGRPPKIFFVKAGRPETDTYWTDWGGNYDDVPETPYFNLFFGRFLSEVFEISDLQTVEYSYLLDGSKIVFNIPRRPWLFDREESEADEVIFYSSAPRNTENNYLYPDALGNNIKIPVRLLTPSVPNKLSDPIRGATLKTEFNFSLVNDDGEFDLITESEFVNAPARIKRADVDNPTLEDFETIRYGVVDSVQIDSKLARFSCADIFRNLTAPATELITTADYPDAPDNSIDKPIPILYGSWDGIELIEVGTNQYLAIDPDYLTAVSAVYDSDGNSISFTVSDGVITATDADTADVSGLADNRIGEIIINEVTEKTSIPYSTGFWDVAEADAYSAGSARIDLLIDSGSVRDLIVKALKNDMAFLIQKNAGLLTLRKWGDSPTAHQYFPWQIMEIPKKDTRFAKQNFISSARVLYGQGDKATAFTADEESIFRALRQKKLGEFETVISAAAEADDLAERLVDRFGNLPATVSLKMGETLAGVNPLDEIRLDVTINGRQFISDNTFTVLEVDPAQDTVRVEAAGFFDYTLACDRRRATHAGAVRH